MAIATVATEYVFSDFLLKEQNKARYHSIRTELAVDKLVTCVAVGLPLLLISLAFAQEVSFGAQIGCFSPSNFSWKQAAYVDSFCWANMGTHTVNLYLHKFFPYILLLLAVLMYGPALFWKFWVAPLLQSDLGFILEELDRCYNRAVTLAKHMATSEPGTPDSDPTEGCFNYPLVEKFLVTKRSSRVLLSYYLLSHGLTLVILVCACVYLGYYFFLASTKDEFVCGLRVGLLASDHSIPEKVQCKLIAVGIFYLLSLVNLIVFIALIPVVIYASIRPLFFTGYARFLEGYQSLPTMSILPTPSGQWDDLNLYLLFLEENISELKSYKYIKVLELLKKQSVYSREFDAMDLLQTLYLVKTDTVDGKPTGATGKQEKQDEIKTAGGDCAGGPAAGNARTAENGCNHTTSDTDNNVETELRELTPLLPGSDVTGSKISEGGPFRQGAM
uniref:Pannexin n=1 Tax=Monopterus albus TaxID=43700 RepID=A0A3Q3JIE5_MONAL|nr:pannexin-1-like [Monopterus albus]